MANGRRIATNNGRWPSESLPTMDDGRTKLWWSDPTDKRRRVSDLAGEEDFRSGRGRRVENGEEEPEKIKF